MGTRHQIYIIANVLGRYRIVAAYHVQSLYPPEAVHMACDLLLHVKEYAVPLGKELQCLQQGRYSKNDAAYPCPCLGALLFQTLQNCYGHYECIWPMNNNSGYTVIDVTDPSSPAYCFWGRDGGYGFAPGYPIDPEGYACRYYVFTERVTQFQDLRQNVQDAILELQGERFISSKQTLDNAWENWSPTLDEMEKEAPSGDINEFNEALQAVIRVKSTENAQEMADTLSSMAGAVEGLRSTLHRERLPKCCDPVIIKGLLIAQDLSNSDELDLSWMQLSPAQVVKVVRAVLQDDSFKISSLNISGNSEIAVGTLSEIFKLREASKLKRLYLFGCAKVEDVRRVDMARRIGMDGGAEAFNSYFPADLSEFRPWKAKPRPGKPRPRV